MFMYLFLGSIFFNVLFLVRFLYAKRHFIMTQRTLRIENEQLTSLCKESKDLNYYFQLKPTRKYIYFSPSTENFFEKEMLVNVLQNASEIYDIIHPEDISLVKQKLSGEIDFSKKHVQRCKTKDGEYSYFEEYTTPIYENGQLVAIKGFLRNVDDVVEIQRQLEYEANHDALTKLYNRNYFERKMEQYNNESMPEVALIVCDLDGLKTINDTYGHLVGDCAIQQVAKILQTFTMENCIVSRIGGDEFALLLTNVSNEQLYDIVENIKKHVEIVNAEKDMELHLSIGYAHCQQSFLQMNQLFKKADRDMYKNKKVYKKMMLSLCSICTI